MTDHQTTEKVFEAVERALAGPASPPPGLLRDAREYFKGYVDGCHNQKEEHHLFPLSSSAASRGTAARWPSC